MWVRRKSSSVLTLFSLALVLPTRAQLQERPNIIFVLVDDWGWNDVGYHNPEILTPHMNMLAATGVRLERNYVAAVCTPSRAALMTGMYPHKIGRQRFALTIQNLDGLSLDYKILPEYLKELGYSTHLVGKWHLGYCNSSYLPTNRGFDTQYGFYNSQINNYAKTYNFAPFPFDFFENDKIVPVTDLRSRFGFQGDLFWERTHKVITEHAVKQLEGEENPLFLYLALPHVHFPVEAPFEYTDLYPYMDDGEKRRSLAAMVTHMDDLIFNMTQTLKETGLYDNSIIVVMSDNGAYSDKWPWMPFLGGGSNYPLRGQKATYYEGGVRVPAFIHSPLLRKPGTVSEEMIHVTDWLPTLLAAAGADETTHPGIGKVDGKNQWPSISCGLRSARGGFVYAMMDVGAGYPVGGIRCGPWKLINFDDNTSLRPPPFSGKLVAHFGNLIPLGKDVYQLYNVESDPSETKDVFDMMSNHQPNLVARLIRKFKLAALEIVPEPFPPPVVPPDLQGCGVITERGFLQTDFCNLDGTLAT